MVSNKGQGLPLNTIIVAIIVIVVLVVIILIFTGQLGGFQGGLQSGEGTERCADDENYRCVAGFQCDGTPNADLICPAGTVCCPNNEVSGLS